MDKTENVESEDVEDSGLPEDKPGTEDKEIEVVEPPTEFKDTLDTETSECKQIEGTDSGSKCVETEVAKSSSKDCKLEETDKECIQNETVDPVTKLKDSGNKYSVFCKESEIDELESKGEVGVESVSQSKEPEVTEIVLKDTDAVESCIKNRETEAVSGEYSQTKVGKLIDEPECEKLEVVDTDSKESRILKPDCKSRETYCTESSTKNEETEDIEQVSEIKSTSQSSKFKDVEIIDLSVECEQSEVKESSSEPEWKDLKVTAVVSGNEGTKVVELDITESEFKREGTKDVEQVVQSASQSSCFRIVEPVSKDEEHDSLSDDEVVKSRPRMKTEVGPLKISEVRKSKKAGPSIWSQDTTQGLTLAQIKEDVQESQMTESMDVDEDSSSQDTYCSEKSFHRMTDTTTNNSSSEEKVSAKTGGISEATTMDAAESEAIPYSEVDMFASQETQEDVPMTEVSGGSSGTIADYSEFIKGSSQGSPRLLQSSTTLSMDESQELGDKPEVARAKKRKCEEFDHPDKSSKLQRIVEEEEEKIDKAVDDTSSQKKSVGVDEVSVSSEVSASKDRKQQAKSSMLNVSPVKVTVKEKEVEISPTADRKRHLIAASPKASRRLAFDSESQQEKPKFILVPDNVKEKAETDVKEIKIVPVSGDIDSSPEIEVLSTKKSRKSVEVVYMSSHSRDSSEGMLKCKVGSKESLRSVKEIVDIVDEKDVDTIEDEEDAFFLRLSPSPSQKSQDPSGLEKNNESPSETDVNVTSYSSSYKSSNASVSSNVKENRKFIPKDPSVQKDVYVVEEEEDKGSEKASPIENSSNSSGSSNGVVGEKMNFKLPLSKNDLASPEDSPLNTDSFTTFSKVKDVAKQTSLEGSEVVSENELGTAGRKRRLDKKNVPVVNICGSDSESDPTPKELQLKKLKTGNDDVTNGHRGSLNTLPHHLSDIYKAKMGRQNSTPHDCEGHTPLTEISTSSIEMENERDATQGIDTIEEVVEYEKEVIVKVNLKLKCLKNSNKIIHRTIQHCEEIRESGASSRLSDCYSSGGLADVSSKNTSPSSTTSGPGPFTLPARVSLISITSSSSTSSGGSSVTQGVMRSKHDFDRKPFIVPAIPKTSKDKSFRSEDAANLMRLEGYELFEQVIFSVHLESLDQHHRGSPIKTVKSHSREKPVTSKSLPVDDSPEEMVTVNQADHDTEPVSAPANELVETPKSTTKSRGGKARSLSKKRSFPFSKGKGKENSNQDKAQDKKDVVQLTPIQESKRGRRTPVHSKSNVNTSISPCSETVILKTPTSKKKKENLTRNSSRTPEVQSVVLDSNKMKPGILVFARWSDKKYYSARLKEESKAGHWMVLFDDGKTKQLVEEFIIPVNELDKGQLVYALGEDNMYMSGIITSVQKKGADVMYCVNLDEGGDVTVPRSDLFMTEDQAMILRETVTTGSPTKTTAHRRADVTLDNVLEGKRSRAKSQEIQKLLDTPGVSGESKTTPRRKVSSPASSESDVCSTATYDVDGVEPESTDLGFKPGKIKGQGRSTPQKHNTVDVCGPMPPANSNIFAGKCFLLTCSTVEHIYESRHSSQDNDNSALENTDNSTDLSEIEGYEHLKYSKSHLAQQITVGGGKVYNKFEDVPPSDYDSCYLIANKMCQTAMYILCLAHSIKIVHYLWIIHSCKEEKCLPSHTFYLPNGYSLEKKCEQRVLKQHPLSRMKVGLIGKPKAFLKFWKVVLKAAGATVYDISEKKWGTKELKDLHVLVSNSCPFEIEKEMTILEKPLVSTTWVVQCLINRAQCKFRGHKDYLYQSLTD